MQPDSPNPRIPEHEIDCLNIWRWSPRAFSSDPIEKETLMSLFEAARWAPSCYNDQPWLFFYANTPAVRDRFALALVDQNKLWAGQAPVLVFLAIRTTFQQNGKPNNYAAFDAGAAWLALSLQARRLGLYSHAMAGFSKERAHEIIGLPDKNYAVLAAIAIGKKASPDTLPQELKTIEYPNQRYPLNKMVFAGTFQPPESAIHD